MTPLLAALSALTVFTFADPAITESSGLVDLGPVMVTTNDSGHDPVLYVVDGRGRTVGRVRYAGHTEDVEALAPGGGRTVWVGDIGDNRERSSIRVYKVPSVGRGDHRVDAPSYELRYPDRPHDAESLVVRHGRVYVITKAVTGGTLYAAPLHLDPRRPNRLTRLARVPLWATDAALSRDGRHLLVRGYGSALVMAFPGYRVERTFALPEQQQGEGVSVGPGGRVRLSSEGAHSAVLQVDIPRGPERSTAPAPERRSIRTVGPVEIPWEHARHRRRTWLLGGLGGLAVLAAAGWALRRPRSHRVGPR